MNCWGFSKWSVCPSLAGRIGMAYAFTVILMLVAFAQTPNAYALTSCVVEAFEGETPPLCAKTTNTMLGGNPPFVFSYQISCDKNWTCTKGSDGIWRGSDGSVGCNCPPTTKTNSCNWYDWDNYRKNTEVCTAVMAQVGNVIYPGDCKKTNGSCTIKLCIPKAGQVSIPGTCSNPAPSDKCKNPRSVSYDMVYPCFAVYTADVERECAYSCVPNGPTTPEQKLMISGKEKLPLDQATLDSLGIIGAEASTSSSAASAPY